MDYSFADMVAEIDPSIVEDYERFNRARELFKSAKRIGDVRGAIGALSAVNPAINRRTNLKWLAWIGFCYDRVSKVRREKGDIEKMLWPV